MTTYDTIVIGGGPGGSIAGTILAQRGQNVFLLERERFPRFHIGESLIPYANDVLREVGLWDKIANAGFMPKLGAEFTLGNARGSQRFWFGRNLASRYAQTFQVERSKFDHILREHARESGCEIAAEAKAETVHLEPNHVTLTYQQNNQRQTVQAKYIIDASGRDTFLGRQLQLPKSDLGLPKKFAIFAHFHHVRRNDPPAEGHISIVRLEDAWCWIIPLDAEKTSVGLVQSLERFKNRKESAEECFARAREEHAELRYRMGDAVAVSDFFTTGDYTYRYHQAAGPRWLLVGDAAGFIDPIFSSGVMLALRSGKLAAEAVLHAAMKNRQLTAFEQNRYSRQVRHMTEVFYKMIRMFYDNRAFEVFMNPIPWLKLPQAVNNLVAGNTELSFFLRLRVEIFYLLCFWQKRHRVAPPLDFSEPARRTPVTA